MELYALALLVYFVCVQLQSANTDAPPKSILHAIFVPSIIIDDEELIVLLPNFILHLKSREMSLDFSYIFYNENGGMVKEMDLPNCYYEGHVEDFPGWTASINICSGMEGSFGFVKQYYYIKPQPQRGVNIQDKITLLHPHLLFSEYPILANSTMRVCEYSVLPEKQRFLQEIEETVVDGDVNKNRVVELVLVNDYTLMFQKFNVSIVLAGVVTWTQFDLFEFPSDNEPIQVLVAFRVYLMDVPLKFDSALLISGRNFLGNVVGLAYKSSMCYGIYATGIVQDRQEVGVSLVAGTSSHELGHILGMSHDDNTERHCKCIDPTGKCIMAGLSTAIAPILWSNCSQSDMLASFKKNPLTEACLFNIPLPSNISTPIVQQDKSIQWQSSPGNTIIALLVLSMCTYC